MGDEEQGAEPQAEAVDEPSLVDRVQANIDALNEDNSNPVEEPVASDGLPEDDAADDELEVDGESSEPEGEPEDAPSGMSPEQFKELLEAVKAKPEVQEPAPKEDEPAEATEILGLPDDFWDGIEKEDEFVAKTLKTMYEAQAAEIARLRKQQEEDRQERLAREEQDRAERGMAEVHKYLDTLGYENFGQGSDARNQALQMTEALYDLRESAPERATVLFSALGIKKDVDINDLLKETAKRVLGDGQGKPKQKRRGSASRSLRGAGASSPVSPVKPRVGEDTTEARAARVEENLRNRGLIK